jgi:hypothetical protein
VNGESVRGEAFLPERTHADVKRMQLPVVLMYKGLRKAKTGGRSYFDILVMDEALTSRLEQLQAKPSPKAVTLPKKTKRAM